MQHPLISIILCTFNGEAFLEEQLRSLLAQTYPNIEIIISDDDSIDGTMNLLQKYKNHPGISIFKNQQNVGYSKNFEVAALQSKGAYLAFCDQDDIWLPTKLEKLYTSIGKHSLVYSDSKLIDERGNDLHKNLSDYKNLQSTYHSKGFGLYNAVYGHTMMVKRELLELALPIPSGYYHDWWIALQASNLNGIQFLNEQLTLYRQHSKTATKTVLNKEKVSRTFSQRYEQYLSGLKWLEILKNNPLEKEKSFYNNFYNLYLLKKNAHYAWPLFWFLLKHHKNIFMFAKKNTLSQLIEIRKLARGEKER